VRRAAAAGRGEPGRRPGGGRDRLHARQRRRQGAHAPGRDGAAGDRLAPAVPEHRRDRARGQAAGGRPARPRRAGGAGGRAAGRRRRGPRGLRGAARLRVGRRAGPAPAGSRPSGTGARGAGLPGRGRDRPRGQRRRARGRPGRLDRGHLPKGADGQVSRVARRFGLVAAAGELATGLGVLPWPEGEAERAAARCFGDWLRARGGAGPASCARASPRCGPSSRRTARAGSSPPGSGRAAAARRGTGPGTRRGGPSTGPASGGRTRRGGGSSTCCPRRGASSCAAARTPGRSPRRWRRGAGCGAGTAAGSRRSPGSPGSAPRGSTWSRPSSSQGRTTRAGDGDGVVRLAVALARLRERAAGRGLARGGRAPGTSGTASDAAGSSVPARGNAPGTPGTSGGTLARETGICSRRPRRKG
jgi:hypothetical protein